MMGFLLVFPIVLIACSHNLPLDSNSRLSEPNGVLIYTTGTSVLTGIDLKTGKKRVVFNTGVESGGFIQNVTKVNENIIIYEECRKGCMLKKINLSKGSIADLFEGSDPTYIQENDTLIFYKNSRKDLYKYKQSEFKKIISYSEDHASKDFSVFNMARSPVQTSQYTVVFLSNSLEVVEYNIDTEKITHLGITNCQPVDFIPPENSIICSPFEPGTVYDLVNIETNKRKRMNLVRTYGVIYVQDQNALIYSSTPFYMIFILSEIFHIYWRPLDSQIDLDIATGRIKDAVWFSNSEADWWLH